MSWSGQHPNCVCTKSMGDSADCQMCADVYEQRQAGCSCWAGWEMPDGTRADPYCEADEWHNRAEGLVVADLKTVLAETLAAHQWRGNFLGCACGWEWPEERTHFCGEEERIANAHSAHVADAVNTVVMFDANRILEIAQMRGMIWWLASDLAADDPDSTPETWVALAEKYWQLGLRSETRFLNLASCKSEDGADHA